MKKKHILLLTLAVVCLSLLWPTALADQKSYPMVLRGGGNMIANYARGSGGTVLNITFERSPYAANQRQPGPGQCAWLDRPLSTDEQLLLQYKSKNNKITALKIKRGNIQVEKYEGNAGGRDLKYLIDAIHNGQIFYVHATKAKTPWGSFYLKITRVGP
ncbi:MAG: hypothetical protein GTN73_10060 [Candidatus Aminicenantes bacterium]|nr:hypothetical protein [Candidatus Aminicenantes bacterium]